MWVGAPHTSKPEPRKVSVPDTTPTSSKRQSVIHLRVKVPSKNLGLVANLYLLTLKEVQPLARVEFGYDPTPQILWEGNSEKELESSRPLSSASA